MNSLVPTNDQLPRPGDVVGGKYRVESVIGKGGMGVVLGAIDTSLGRRVAIKFLMPHKADREGAAARFGREARAAASIQSEHVVRIFEVSTLPNGASYIVMEHLAGADLGAVLASRGVLPITEAVDHLLQACEALGEAHGRGIVHRDLKPQNLFVTPRNDGTPCVKVLDFGISKAVDEEAPNLTATDTVMGTPLYMSPEQVRSLKNVDHRSDIWALGAILFELLTAAPIFDAQTMSALCAMIAMDPPTPLRARLPSAPAELEAVILRCLHKDPAGRFADVGALAEALAPFASERGRVSAARVVRVVRSSGSSPVVGAASASSTGTSPFGPTSDVTAQDPSRSSFVPSSQGATASTSQRASAPPGSGPSLPMGISHMSASFGPPLVVAPTMGGVPSTVNQVPPTAGMGSNYPPGAMPLQTGAAPAWVPHPTTQQNWQHATASTMTGQAPQRGSNTLLVAGLGGLVALVVLGGAVGGGLFYMSRKSSQAEEAAAAAASAQAAAAPPVATAPAATSAVSAAAPPAAGGPKKPVVAAAATSSKAAAATASTASAPPAKSKADEDLESQKRIAQGQCSHMQFLLRSNDPKNNDQARTVKNLTCLRASGPQGATCERSVCRSACSMLQDQSCLFQLDNGERNFPAKF